MDLRFALNQGIHDAMTKPAGGTSPYRAQMPPQASSNDVRSDTHNGSDRWRSGFGLERDGERRDSRRFHDVHVSASGPGAHMSDNKYSDILRGGEDKGLRVGDTAGQKGGRACRSAEEVGKADDATPSLFDMSRIDSRLARSGRGKLQDMWDS